MTKAHRDTRFIDQLRRAASPEAREGIRHSLASEEVRPIDEMHMEMRLGRAASVANVTEDLASGDAVATPDSERARPHVRIEGIEAAADVDYHVISARIDQVERDG